MTTAYTSLLGLALPVTGELSGTWGDIVNNSITSLLDSSIAGTTNVSTDADVTLTTTTGAANTAREAILLFSGARTALRTVTAPAQSKVYTVINATTGGYSVKLVGAGPTTGVTIVAGESAVCAWNGSDFVKVSNTGGTASFTNVTVTGTTTLSGLTASTALALDASKNVVSVTNTGSGNNVLATSPTLSGTTTIATLNLTNALGTTYGGTGLTSFTANGVVYASSSSALATGSALSFDGTNLGVGTASPSEKVGINQGNIYALRTGGAKLRLADQNNECSVESSPTSGDSQLVFKSNATEGMRLTSTGLGIGTSSPTEALTVTGDATYKISIKRAADSSYAAFGVTANNLLIYNNGAERMRLDSSGNLGLGVTPSAWSASFKAIQVGSVGSVYGVSSFTGVGNNFFNDGTAKYITTNFASYYAQGSGSHAWYNAPSGTAGNAITFTQAMTLDASGNLGIGSSSPNASYRLTLAGASASNGLTIYNTSDSNRGGRIQASGSAASGAFDISTTSGGYYMTFGIDSTEKMRLDLSGNLGIGTASPSVKLEVAGAAKLTGTNLSIVPSTGTSPAYVVNTNTGGNFFVGIDNSTGASFGTGAYGRVLYSSAAYPMAFFTNDLERARIDSSGNLGIGTSSPATRLAVASAVGTSGGLVTLTNTSAYANGNAIQIDFNGENANGGMQTFAAINAYNQFAVGNNYGNIAFKVANAGSIATAMTLNYLGNLGIGTSSPTSKLTVIGSVKSASGTQSSFYLSNAAQTNGFLLGRSLGSDDAQNFFIYDTVAAATRLYLDASGNLGIGTSSPATKLDVATASGDCIIRLGNGTSQARFAIDSDGPYIYALTSGDNALRVFTPAGSQAMTLDASGNLRIGTTAALFAANERVSINGATGEIGQTIYGNGTSSIGLLLFNSVATGATSGKQISFVNSSGTEVGSVTSNGTATLFNTTSDQRLKENIKDADSSASLIDAIQVRQFDWKSDGSHTRYGFVAQELVTVAPEAVHQPTDSEEMMAVDYSKLVPMLVKEIQSLRKRLADAGI